MGTERDFVVKKGLKVAEGITLGGHSFDDIDITSEATDADDHIMTALAIKNRIDDIASPLAGSTSIVTTGTITTGTWQATDIGVAHGGTGVSTLTNGGVLLGSGTGAITAMAVLSDGQMIVGDGTTDPVAESGSTLRTSIGVGTGNTVQFTGINLGHASDTTIVRASAGQITVEGTAVVLAGGANHDGFSDYVANEHIDWTGDRGSTNIHVNNVPAAGSATSAGTVSVNPNDAGGSFVTENNLIMFLPDADGSHAAGNYRPESSTDFHYNPGTTILTVPKISSALTGNVTGNASGSAGTVTSIGNLTGEVTSSNRATTIANNAVTLAKMAGLARGKIIYGDSSGDPAALALGSNGQVLTTDGTDISWGSAGGGGASAIDGLSDASTTATSVWLGSTPANATDYNAALGIGALDAPNGTNGTKNVALGYNAGTLNTEGFKNVFVGYAAGAANTNADHNVFVGSQSGKVNTTGIRNIALGSDSYNGTSENDNIAIGYNALGGSVNGAEYTVAIGNYTLDTLTTGDNNTAVGHNSATAVNTGNHNTTIGSYSYFRATDGTYNVVTGYNSGGGLRSGSYNIVTGYNSMGQVNNDGDYNVAIGTHSMNAATGNDVNYNTAIGTSSLQSITSGAKNIALGQTAGNNITSGDNNVVIGAADVSDATADDQLSISSGDGGVTWITGNSNGFVTHTNGSNNTFIMFGEEGDLYSGTGSTGNANGYQFSYGNGAQNSSKSSSGNDFGLNVPFACKLIRVDITYGNSGNVSSGTTTFVPVKNGSNLSGNLSTSHSSGVHDTHHTGLAHAYAAGDRFNLKTTTSSRQVGPFRMTATFERTA